MEAPIPPPGTGLLGPPEPIAVLPSMTCPCSPSVRRSDRRSCCGHGDLVGDVRGLALKLNYDILSALLRLKLAYILTVIGPFETRYRHSTSRRPPGPHSGLPGWQELLRGRPLP